MGHDMLVVADATTVQELAHFGMNGLKREETALIVVTAFVAREGFVDQSVITGRAFEILSRVDALLQADWTMGGLCHLATIQPFDGEAEALAIANGVRYGLACSVWTRDLDRAHRFAGRVESGIVWVNCWMERDLRTPFGGMKDSGVGREGGLEALRFFTEPRNVCIRIAEEGR
jgi:hypothetical protein